MISGPRVDIYVGQDKKHYPLPKLLLCYYSPYFDRCFNGNFKEGESQKLELPEDEVADFELLIEHLLTGSISMETIKATTKSWNLERCIGFLSYTDKYLLGEVASNVIMDSTKSFLANRSQALKSSQIEVVFRALPAQHPLRVMMVRAAISKGLEPHRYPELELEGFAAEVLEQQREMGQTWSWFDPAQSEHRKNVHCRNH